jgi:hypothetical protein
MNSKSVLSKIFTLLASKEVKFTDAKDAEGQILQSPTFDLGETVDVIAEDGSKTAAPDGEHEIELTDSEGNKVVIRIETKDGKIESRENVEEANPADLESVDEEVVDKKAAVEEHMADATTEIAKSLPNTTDEDIRNSLGDDTDETKDPVIRLGYRIDEMEKMVKSLMEKMESAAPTEGAPEVSSLTPSPITMSSVEPDEEEEELPKLDGAPLEPNALKGKQNFGKKSADYQSSFLSKLYR